MFLNKISLDPMVGMRTKRMRLWAVVIVPLVLSAVLLTGIARASDQATAVSDLIEKLQDETKQVRISSASALGVIGPTAKDGANPEKGR